jgi:hypothetical protein
MDMLISSMMDVVIISAKLVCHLCFVCKLNYLFGAHMCYGGVTALITVSSINSAVVHVVCWWAHSKIHKNDTSKALQCTHHIVLLDYATIKLAKLKIVNDTTSIIERQGKLRRILSDAFKCTEVALSYVCNNISTPMAPLLYIRLRWDLWSDFLTCSITFQHQWLLYSTLHWGFSSLQGSYKFSKDWQRHQGNKKTNRNQTTWATPRSTDYKCKTCSWCWNCNGCHMYLL